MAVDKDLFLHDLAVVTIMYNEGHYIKEWLDYHLLAGVDHFYIYDHESTDNTKEILQPYIEAGVVTYSYAPGANMFSPTKNECIRNNRFFCRYMAFIDADEFIFPHNDPSIVDVLDDVMSKGTHIAGLALNWNVYGSNYQDTADYSRGVMERFTRRAPNDAKVNTHVKTIANPRRVSFSHVPHSINYFDGFYSANENAEPATRDFTPVADKRIVVNHYITKSKEEALLRRPPNTWTADGRKIEDREFKHSNNEVFDDSILDYVKSRRDAICPAGGGCA